MAREGAHIWLMNTFRTAILELADAYCAVKSISLSTLSHKIVNDGKVLPRITKGHDIHTETLEKILVWFMDNWVDGMQVSQGVREFIVFLSRADLHR
jgi:hypothetical protein